MNLILAKMEDSIMDTLSLALSRMRTQQDGHIGGKRMSSPGGFARGMSRLLGGNPKERPLISFMHNQETDFSIMLTMLRDAGLEPTTNGRRITIGKNEHNSQVVCVFDEDGKLISIRARY